jgi:hypothetical protein
MPIYLPAAFPRVAPAAGQYLVPASPGSATTSAVLGNGSLRLAPWVLTRAMSIDHGR